MRNTHFALFICAGLLLSGGAMLSATTIWSILRMSYLFWVSELGVELSSGVIFLAGALLCLPACWLATILPNSTKLTTMATTLMALAATSMVMLSVGLVAVGAVTRAVRRPDLVNASLHRAMTHSFYEPAVKSAFSAMQIELKCCGIQSPSDWTKLRHNIPLSCCRGSGFGKRQTPFCSTPDYTRGCLRPVLADLRHFTNSLAVLGTAIIMTMAVTMFASAFLLVTEDGGTTQQQRRNTASVPIAIITNSAAHPMTNMMPSLVPAPPPYRKASSPLLPIATSV